MTITGLPRFQRKAMREFLGKRNTDGDYELHFEDSISLRRLSSLWYGGGMVNVKYNGYTFHIEAIGDVYADLYSTRNDRHIAYVKDKYNNGNFGSEMLSYFRSDTSLEKILAGEHHRYRLEMCHNNWWECFVTDPQGVFHDLMWALDQDDLFEGIEAVLNSLDATINDLEETTL